VQQAGAVSCLDGKKSKSYARLNGSGEVEETLPSLEHLDKVFARNFYPPRAFSFLGKYLSESSHLPLRAESFSAASIFASIIVSLRRKWINFPRALSTHGRVASASSFV
jgi:hypothetical protein